MIDSVLFYSFAERRTEIHFHADQISFSYLSHHPLRCKTPQIFFQLCTFFCTERCNDTRSPTRPRHSGRTELLLTKVSAASSYPSTSHLQSGPRRSFRAVVIRNGIWCVGRDQAEHTRSTISQSVFHL